MLKSLTIENYALIESLGVEWDEHLNIITGETGAGKSILLGALGLLLGAKNEGQATKDLERNCVVEATFDIKGHNLEAFFEDNDLDYADEITIRRVITPAGKSRAFINDMPVQLATLKELGARLIDIHSQHRNMILSDETFRIDTVDTLASSGEQVAEYRALYDELRAAERELNRMVADAESLRKDEEWLRYQVEEFDVAALRQGELQELEQELAVLENAEQIGEALITVRNIFDAEQIGVLEQLSAAENAVQRVSRNYPQGEEIAARLHSVVQELKDVSATADSDSERIDDNPERLQRLTERVNMIYSMCQKHRVQTLDELIAELQKIYPDQTIELLKESAESFLGELKSAGVLIDD